MAKGTVNKVIIIGRLGADPDIRYSANGVAVAKFNVATNERVPAGEGNWEDRTEWHRIVTFGKTAEFCGNYLGKGKLIYLEGTLRTQQWEDAQGTKRYTTEVVARDIQFVGGPGDDQGSSGQGGGSAQGGGSGRGGGSSDRQAYDRSLAEDLPPSPPGKDDEIPF